MQTQSPSSPRRASICSLFLVAGLAATIFTAVPTARAADTSNVITTESGQPSKPAATPIDALPIRNITLYRSGVGAFIRQGTIAGDAKVQLKFDVSQINDVLKTLQVLDRSGGRVDSVTYGSKDPLSRRLGSFALQVGDNPSVTSLLERLRGAKVTLTVGEKPITGTVLSTEVRKVVDGGTGNGAVAVDVPHVNLLTPSGIRSIAIRQVTDFAIDDKQLADDLSRALSAMAESRAERIKAVDLTLSGTGDRNIAVGYIHETPVWKTSYRLVLPEGKDGSKEGESGDKPASPQGMLQGWAIVENTTDQDWSGVRLALVSGRPVSFKMDLYEPLYVSRQEIPVPTVPGVISRAYDGSFGEAPPMPVTASGAPAAGGRPGSPGVQNMRRAYNTNELQNRGQTQLDASMLSNNSNISSGFSGYYSVEGYSGVTGGNMIDYAPPSAASGQEVGEVFQFTLDNPVTIERQRSAMIPIMNAPVGGKRVSIYNAVDGSRNPMRGVQIVNETELQLLPGPVSVFDAGAYAGDAQINQVSPGDKRFLTYAVDLDVTVVTSNANNNAIVTLSIFDGQFIQTLKQTQSTTYKVQNKDKKRGRAMIIEHPKADGWTLTAPAKADELTPTLNRFTLPVPSGETKELVVAHERIERQTIGIDSFDQPTLLRLKSEGKISDAVLTALAKISAKQSEINTAQRSIEEADRQLEKLRPDQTRIAGMMERLDKTSDTYRNLLSKLNRQEGDIDKLSDNRTKLAESLDKLRTQLNDMLRGLKVE